jgi:hypothetical protein
LKEKEGSECVPTGERHRAASSFPSCFSASSQCADHALVAAQPGGAFEYASERWERLGVALTEMTRQSLATTPALA